MERALYGRIVVSLVGAGFSADRVLDERDGYSLREVLEFERGVLRASLERDQRTVYGAMAAIGGVLSADASKPFLDALDQALALLGDDDEEPSGDEPKAASADALRAAGGKLGAPRRSPEEDARINAANLAKLSHGLLIQRQRCQAPPEPAAERRGSTRARSSGRFSSMKGRFKKR